MSYQDKQIAKLEEQNEQGMLLEGLKLRLTIEIEDLKIKRMMSILAFTSIELKIAELEKKPADTIDEKKAVINDILSNPITKRHNTIFQDILVNPNSKRCKFYVQYYNNQNKKEIEEVYRLLLSGELEEKVAMVSPLFKEFLFKITPANQE